MGRSIRISDETYEKLVVLKGKFEQLTKSFKSYDDVLKMLIEKFEEKHR